MAESEGECSSYAAVQACLMTRSLRMVRGISFAVSLFMLKEGGKREGGKDERVAGWRALWGLPSHKMCGSGTLPTKGGRRAWRWTLFSDALMFRRGRGGALPCQSEVVSGAM